MKKLSSYLSAGIAATATFQSSDAATVVTLYGPGVQSPSTPSGISIGLDAGNGFLDNTFLKNNSFFAYGYDLLSYVLSSGSDFKAEFSGASGRYSSSKVLGFGARSGSANYANISFNGNDGVYEAVGQFNLDGLGTGFLIALAINDDNSALSISAGKAAIDAVPEPSAIALLALGAGGMAMRRRRKVA